MNIHTDDTLVWSKSQVEMGASEIVTVSCSQLGTFSQFISSSENWRHLSVRERLLCTAIKTPVVSMRYCLK